MPTAVGLDLSAFDPILVVAIFGSTLGFAIGVAMLHSPHHVISDVAIANGQSGRKHVFVVSRHNLLGGGDSEEWKRLTSGLGAHKLSALAVSPGFERDRTLFVATFGGGVFRSANCGRSWVACNTGLSQRYITRLCIATDFETSGVILALGLDGVVYASTNGMAWRAAFDAREELAPNATSDTSTAAASVLSDPMRDAGEAWASCRPRSGVTALAAATDGFLAGTSGGALYASRDAGASWAPLARIDDGTRISCLEVPATTSLRERIFVGTDGAGLFRVKDNGRVVEERGSSRELQNVTALDSRRTADGRLELFACTWRSALLLSGDEGESWTRSARGLTKHRQADELRFGAPHFGVVAIDQAANERVYVGGFDGLFSATDPTRSWEPVETLSPGIVIELALSPEHEGGFALAATTYGGGLAVRPDLLTPWRTANTGAPTTRLGPVRFSPAYARDGTLFAGCEGSVLVSRDRGYTWQACALTPIARRERAFRIFARLRSVERGASRYLGARFTGTLKALFQAVALRTIGRVSRFVFPTLIAASPDYERDRTLFVGTRTNGIFRSRDGGRTFQQVWDADNRFVHSLVFSAAPATDGLLLASTSGGLYLSRDGGTTWKRERQGKAFAGALLAISPDYRHDQTVFVAGRDGLHRSRDGGKTWEARTVAQTDGCSIGGIALSPGFATDRTMLVHVRGDGLFRSTDAGETFARLAWGLDEYDHAFCPLSCFPDSTTLFQFSPRFDLDRTVIAARVDQIYVSRDAGDTWVALDRVTRYQSSRREIHYRGRWTLDFHDEHSAHRAHRSARPLDAATMTFFGTRISWLGSRGPDHGIADVLIDGQLSASIDLYAPRPARACELHTADLPRGRHSITVQVRREQNAQSRGRVVTIDAFDVRVDTGSGDHDGTPAVCK